MLDNIFLVPIDHRGIHGALLPRYLKLQSWCERNNSEILTCHGQFLNFARNLLATGKRGYPYTNPPDAEWLFWIDSDIDFNIEKIEELVAVSPEHKFVTGWYRSDYSDRAMVGTWDENYFRKNLYMPFASVKWLDRMAEEKPSSLFTVDWCGFGFTKVHRSIYEQMDYPYYPLNRISIPDCDHPHNKGEKFDITDLSFEDVSFCRNCYKQTGIKPVVFPRVRLPHNKNFFV